jgi:nicotinamide mononucleotide transporter
LNAVLTALKAMTVWDWAAFLLGLLTVWYTVKEHIWCWPTGLGQVLISIFIFYNAKLYSDAILQIVYVYLQIYGWVYWVKGGSDRGELPVTVLTPTGVLLCLAAVGVFTAGWGWVMHRYTDAAAPIADAFIVGASLVAQWLLTRKKLESWIFWIVVDLVGIVVFAQKGLPLMSILYVVFLGLATAGFFEWRKSRRASLAVAA